MLRWTFVLSATCLFSMSSAILGIGDVFDKVKEVFDKVQDIPEIAIDLVELIDALTGGIIDIADVGQDIDDLANTLSVCIDDLTDIFPSALPVDKIININVEIDFFGIDLDHLPFILIAGTLLPLKSEIEDVCIDKVPDLIQGVRTLMPGTSPSPTSAPVTPSPNTPVFGTGGFFGGGIFASDAIESNTDEARRLFLNIASDAEACSSDYAYFCEASTPTFPMDELNKFNYEIMRGFLLAMGVLPIFDDNKPVTADTLQGWRGAQLTVGILSEATTQICEVVKTCTPPDKVLECKNEVTVCGTLKKVLKWLKILVDYVVASASYHNSRINGVRVGAIYEDRLNIIHNQFALRDLVSSDLQKKHDDLSMYTNGNFSAAITDRTNKYNARTTDLDNKYSARTTYLNNKFSAAMTDRQNKYESRTEYLDDAFLDSTNDRQNKFVNRTKHLNFEFDAALENRQTIYDAITLDLQIKYDSLTNNIRVLNDTVNSLPNLNGAASENNNGGGNGNGNSRANTGYGMILDDAKQTGGDRLITINITATHLYIIGGTFIGMYVLLVISAVVFIFKCCNGRNSGYSQVQKYEIESEMEIQ